LLEPSEDNDGFFLFCALKVYSKRDKIQPIIRTNPAWGKEAAEKRGALALTGGAITGAETGAATGATATGAATGAAATGAATGAAIGGGMSMGGMDMGDITIPGGCEPNTVELNHVS
jgi:hypothetical protein